MCTVSLRRDAGSLLITMNRDERRGRAEELPPRIHHGNRASWIGPADGERGGTWIGANGSGMAACLLNGYVAADLELVGRDDLPSRGFIIPELLDREPEAAWSWLDRGLDPTRYPSFTLVVATVERAEVFRWRLDDGIDRRPLATGWSVITSSFWRTDEVVDWRERQFRDWLAAGTEHASGLPTFNLLEVADRREWSPFMTRPISSTRSLTQLEIGTDDDEIRLRYWRRDGERAIEPDRPTATLALATQSAAAAP